MTPDARRLRRLVSPGVAGVLIRRGGDCTEYHERRNAPKRQIAVLQYSGDYPRERKYRSNECGGARHSGDAGGERKLENTSFAELALGREIATHTTGKIATD